MQWFLSPLLVLAFTLTAAAQAMPEPTEHHKVFENDPGTWNGIMTMTMPGSTTPVSMSGKEVNRLIDGGIWLLSEFEMGPFKGHGQIGYDTAQKKYVGTWVDNSSTHLNVMEGTYDKKTKALTMTFRGIDPASGEAVDMKSVGTRQDKNTRNFVMYSKRDGKWVESFSIAYKRSE